MRRVTYRIGQFGRALRASIRPLSQREWAEVRHWLPEPAVALFAGMSRSDQKHSLEVLHILVKRGGFEPVLMQAALLHDCAKRRDTIRLWHRIAFVLLKVSRSGWLERIQGSDPDMLRVWSRPFWILMNHASLGADLAAEVRCLPVAVELIRWHQADVTGRTDFENATLLRMLQAADDAC